MKRAMIFLFLMALLFGMAGMVQAREGGLGSFFTPAFRWQGEVVVYKSPAVADAKIRAADCCQPGDTFKMLVRSSTNQKSLAWISSDVAEVLKGGCNPSRKFPDQRQVRLNGAEVVKLKLISAPPGGMALGAYVTMTGNGWSQTKGMDSCEFYWSLFGGF